MPWRSKLTSVSPRAAQNIAQSLLAAWLTIRSHSATRFISAGNRRANDWLGVKIVSYNWQRDGWEQVWARLGRIISELEDEAMTPVAKVARKVNRAMRNDLKNAA
ncbi:hypothetical protein C1H69_15555 [Billgrantia endophytica]|uniref:Uncharacterized protein n=1 Tax=Billgrantia endophytica TaxID=2033802 RepID=A0A2N7TZZ5_9GAMM|nr:hypothetical protein C1H69_15555 [Halomonas endophytica]